MAEHVHEIVDNHIQWILRHVSYLIDELFSIRLLNHLVVGESDVLEAMAIELLAQEKFFELVLAFLVVLVFPAVGITPFDLIRHQACEHGISRILGGGG